MIQAGAKRIALGLIFAALVGCQMTPARNTSHLAAQAYLRQAHADLKAGLTDSALASFGLALEEDAHLTAAHLGMGNIFRKRGQYKFAREAYLRAVHDDPTNFDARYYLGVTEQTLGHLARAVRAYLAALSIDPNSADANRDLASAYLQLGDPQQAVPYAKKAAELSPYSESALANLGAAYNLTGQYRKALAAYQAAAQTTDQPPEAVLLGMADASIQLGQYDAAVQSLTTLIQRDPTALAYERRGFAQFKQHNFQASLGDYRAAMKLKPKDPPALNGVGVCLMTLYIQGDRQDEVRRNQALDLWRQSVQIDPNQPHIVDLISRYEQM